METMVFQLWIVNYSFGRVLLYDKRKNFKIVKLDIWNNGSVFAPTRKNTIYRLLIND